MKDRSAHSKSVFSKYEKVISNQTSLINILLSIFGLVVGIFAVVAGFITYQNQKLKEDVEAYIKKNISQILKEERDTRITSRLDLYLKTEKYFLDFNATDLALIKENGEFSDENIQQIINHIQSRGIFVIKLDEKSQEEGRVVSAIINILSRECRSARVDEFFRSLISPKIVITSGGMANPYERMLDYFYSANKLDSYENDIINLLKLELEHKYIGAVRYLADKTISEAVASVTYDISMNKNSLIGYFQNNSAYVDYFFKNNDLSLFKLINKPVKNNASYSFRFDSKESMSFSIDSLFMEKWCEIKECNH